MYWCERNSTKINYWMMKHYLHYSSLSAPPPHLLQTIVKCKFTFLNLFTLATLKPKREKNIHFFAIYISWNKVLCNKRVPQMSINHKQAAFYIIFFVIWQLISLSIKIVKWHDRGSWVAATFWFLILKYQFR